MSYSNPVTQKDIHDLEEKLAKKYDNIMVKMDWLIGEYKKHDEEHVLLNNRLSNHNDRLEKIEEKIGISV